MGGWEGGPSDHSIDRSDAQLYAAKYNRELLRKTIQVTKEKMKQLSGRNLVPSFKIEPIVSPGFTGILGTF